MATSVITPIGGGVNIEDLTSGELLLYSLLKTGYIQVKGFDTTGGYVDFGHDNYGSNRKGVDMSKISQISFGSSTTKIFKGYVQWKNDSTWTHTDFSQNTHFSISAPSGDNSHSMFTISAHNSEHVCVKVTSFTTTDGKVHTKDNLNY